MLFLPTVRHVEKPSHNGEGRGRQSLLFTVCCRYLWSRESFVSLVGGCWPPIVYLPISRLHASLSFFFADSPRYLYSPLPPPPLSPPSFLFVSRPSRLLHPLLLPLPSSNGRRTRTLTRRPSCTCRKGKTSFGPGSKRASPLYRRFPPDPLPDLRGLIMLGSFEAR